MTNNKIIGVGISGLVGSRIVELLSPLYSFEDVSRKTGTDITKKEDVLSRLQQSNAQTVLHLAAKTDVDGCEKEKELGEKSEAWNINVNGTKNVIEACEATGKKLLYISTDMVFDGNQELTMKYSEEEAPHPLNFYALTKYEAEKLVQQATIPSLILRIAYPYRAQFEKKEYVRMFKWLLEEKSEIKAVDDHYFTPTFIDDLAPVIDAVIRNNVTGILHAVGEEYVSPYMVALAIAQKFNLHSHLISPTTREEYFKDRAIRGFNLSLKSDKMSTLGVRMHSFSEGLEILKQQL